MSFTIVKFFYILFTTVKAFYQRQIPSVTTALITSQISGPCCDSDIEPDQSFARESHVRQQVFVVFEDFYCQKKQNPAWFR